MPGGRTLGMAEHGNTGHICDERCPHHRVQLDGQGWGTPADHLGYRRDERAERFGYLGALRDRVLVYDGGMGTQLFTWDLNADDYGGEETNGCPEWLLRTRPEIVPEIHSRYLKAGADVIETNSFGSMPHVLSEFGLQDYAEDLAREAAQIARGVADDFATADKPRYVAGSLGPCTKLISLGHIGWDELFASYRVGARGLIAGGADCLLVETCQDILQVRCAVAACRAAMRDLGKELPIQVQVTVETTGTMLAGTDVAGALASIEAMPVDAVGMNCATGPDLMDSHIRHLCENATRWVSCLPNAGLPRNVGGKAVFDLTPEELARWHVKFVKDYGLNLAGGCCGTGPEHIKAIADAVSGLSPGRSRIDSFTPSVASLYQQTTLKQDTGILLVGERTNATGSKKFRDMLLAEDWDGMTELAQEQVAEGAHVLDVSVAWTGRDEVRDMRKALSRFGTAVQIPIMLDSTQVDVLAEGLKLVAGKPLINSVNFEEGVERFDRICALAKEHGAALVALTIDEDPEASMAKSVERKIEIATRIYERATEVHGIPGSDLLFDLLTFPITQGDEDTRKLGQWTLEAMEILAKKYPDAGFILGLSNISFGVKAFARRVLNSVYLDEAVKRGLTAAILNAGKIVPVANLSEDELKMARDLIYDRREFDAKGECTYDPLFAFVDHFGNKTVNEAEAADAELELDIRERLKQRIIKGRKVGVDVHLEEAMNEHGITPLTIINDILLDGMKVVGELFGSGQMQLPFVLQSAECMKTCVRYLEPLMEKADGAGKGTMVLATVKGDVHDIGKNLVDIILSNNGYTVVNLGIKQSVEAIIEAAKAHPGCVIGMSGLLVKSTVVMKENLEYLAERGLDHQVILGGAALNRGYVENDLRGIYSREALAADDVEGAAPHRVWYATDAFDGLQFMDELCGNVDVANFKLTTKTSRAKSVKTAYEILEEKLEAGKAYVPSDVPPPERIPEPPFWGRKVVRGDELDLATITSYINKNALYRGQWGFRQGQKLSQDEWQEMVAREADPVLRRWIAKAAADKMLEPAVVYGYWPCASDKNDLIIYEPDTGAERSRIALPRQAGANSKHLCVSDFFRGVGADPIADEQRFIPAAAWAAGARDVIALSVVTMGGVATEHCQRLFGADNYQEYLYFYGLSVESAEALAEYWHKRVRQQLGIAGKDATDMAAMFQQGYQGSRFSFGYPACPNLEHQTHLEALLEWDEIGLSLSDEFQLDPEQSTSAIVCHHPSARYFNL
jgi:5-methyltetrahydrofolate--homocysteine methyltransferase